MLLSLVAQPAGDMSSKSEQQMVILPIQTAAFTGVGPSRDLLLVAHVRGTFSQRMAYMDTLHVLIRINQGKRLTAIICCCTLMVPTVCRVHP